MPKPYRSRKYHPEVVAKIEQALSVGATYALAAAYAGISADTLTRWQDRYTEFADKVRLAEGRGAITSLAQIQKAATDGDWRAAAWKMEKRYPADYGKTVQENRLTGSDGKGSIQQTFTIKIDHGDRDRDE